MVFSWKKFCHFPPVRFLASLPLAVVGLSAFVLLMVVGTWADYRYGSQAARILIFDSWPFHLVVLILFLNIFFAALVRLPPVKRLYGFYLIHLGLLLLLLGAGFSHWWGLDGKLSLIPGRPTRHVLLPETSLYVSYRGNEKLKSQKVSRVLPEVFKEFRGGDFLQVGNVQVLLERYLPFAQARVRWEAKTPDPWPRRYLWVSLGNEEIQERIELNNVDYASYQRSLGPLNFSLFPEIPVECFQAGIRSKKIQYLLLSPDRCHGLALKDEGEISVLGYQIQKEKSDGMESIKISGPEGEFRFYPEISIFPIDGAYRVQPRRPLRWLALDYWRKGRHVVFLKGQKVAVGSGREWIFQDWSLFNKLRLPWKNLEWVVTRWVKDRERKKNWEPGIPDIEGKTLRAAQVQLLSSTSGTKSKRLWLEEGRPQSVSLEDGSSLTLAIGPRAVPLPFAVELEEFILKKQPGTEEPASYESHIKVLGIDSVNPTRISMNQPLKKGGFTFYQASFFPIEGNSYGSVLSVNWDPGRALKYGGGLLLIVGILWHFHIKSKMRKGRS